MVGNESHIRREKSLVLVVDANANIGPPKECLRERRPIVEPDLRFHQRFARMQTDPNHPLHAMHRLVFAEPNGLAAIGRFFNFPMDWHIGGRAVVLRPIELHSTRYPGSQQAYERGFNYVLPIEDLVCRLLLEKKNR